jgi:hypothetical protein
MYPASRQFHKSLDYGSVAILHGKTNFTHVAATVFGRTYTITLGFSKDEKWGFRVNVLQHSEI